MRNQVRSAVISKGRAVVIQVQLSLTQRGLPRWKFTGLVEKEVREGRERILAAFRANKIVLPRANTSIAFFPAELRKSGSGLDLPLAISVLQAHQLVPRQEIAAVAELDLEGNLHSVRHEYALVDRLLTDGHSVILSGQQFALWREHPLRKQLRFCNTLSEVISFLRETREVPVYEPEKIAVRARKPDWPISQSLVRILCLCLAGGHHTFLFGAPGVGKSSAEKIVRLLLPSENAEAIRQRRIQSSLLGTDTSRIVMIGSTTPKAIIFGTQQKRGVLFRSPEVVFLDEVAEYKADCREAFRQFLEITPYTQESQEFTSTVIATSNPCPCGFAGTSQCSCRPDRKAQYLKRISGSLLDRFAIVWRVGEKDQRLYTLSEWNSLQTTLRRVRKLQFQRQKQSYPPYARNYDWQHLRSLGLAIKESEMISFRRQLIPLQLARTIADWENQKMVDEATLSEAQLLSGAYSELSVA